MPPVWVDVRDETTITVTQRHMALDSLIDRATPEYVIAAEALRTFRRFWWYNETTGTMNYLTPAADANG
jgi:hypothetical protein